MRTSCSDILVKLNLYGLFISGTNIKYMLFSILYGHCAHGIQRVKLHLSHLLPYNTVICSVVTFSSLVCICTRKPAHISPQYHSSDLTSPDSPDSPDSPAFYRTHSYDAVLFDLRRVSSEKIAVRERERECVHTCVCRLKI